MAQMIADAVSQATRNFVDSLAIFLPKLVTTISIIVAGWLIAIVLRTAVRAVLRWLSFNAWAERSGVGPLLKSAGLPAADVTAGAMVFWLVFLGFLLSGIDVLGFPALQGLLAGFAAFVPRLLVALVILVVAFVVANFAWRATLLAAVNARIPSPRLLSGAVRWLILILAGAMALEQIAVARTVVLTALAIAFGAVMLGIAIAFGLGGRGIARRILEHQFPERERSGADEISHL
jgi:small-conductance mechanosensitive channel